MRLTMLFLLLSLFALSSVGTAQTVAAAATSDSASRHAQLRDARYHSQILTFAPVQFTENGVGFSFGYECGLDKAGIVAFTLPMVATFNTSNNNNNTVSQTEPNYNPMFYLMPGVKFYPNGSRERVAYSIGTNMVIGDGVVTENSAGVKYKRNRLVIGPLVNTAININPTDHFYLGLEFGMGFSYLHIVDGQNRTTRFLTQGGFKIGYRF